MDIKQFMESKSISGSRSVENNSDKRFQKKAANVVAYSSSPF